MNFFKDRRLKYDCPCLLSSEANSIELEVLLVALKNYELLNNPEVKRMYCLYFKSYFRQARSYESVNETV